MQIAIPIKVLSVQSLTSRVYAEFASSSVDGRILFTACINESIGMKVCSPVLFTDNVKACDPFFTVRQG